MPPTMRPLRAPAITQGPGDRLTNAPNYGVNGLKDADTFDAKPERGEEEREDAPAHAVVEIVDEASLALYSLAGGAEVVGLIKSLGRVGERSVAEVNRVLGDYFHARDSMEPVTREDLAGRIADGLVTVLDVRPAEEFSEGHLPGARNIPLVEIERRLRELPKTVEVVAYCRGPYCVLAFKAVAALRAKGFKAVRLEDGFPEWKVAGLRVEA